VRLVLAKVGPLLTGKEYAKAAAVLEEALSKEANQHAELWFALGNCRLLKGENGAAVKAYGQAVTLEPNHAHAWLNMAKAHYDNKQYRKAGRCFARGYEAASEKQADTLYFSGAAYLMGGAYHEAIASFERLFAAHGKSIKPEWREQYIHALLGANQPKRALPLIQELAAQSSGDKQAQWQEILLHQYVQLGMHHEALVYARELVEQQPGETKWWKALVHIQLSANRLEDALAALTIYSYLAPLNQQESRLLADLFLQTGIPAKAAPLYARQLEQQGDSQALHRLAIAYHQMDQGEQALAVLSQYGNVDKDPRLLMLKGEICYSRKRYAEAAASYRQAAGKHGNHQGQAWLMAGYAAMQVPDLAASEQALAQAARFDKEKRAATLALGQLKQTLVQ
jgi:tetratricopeptide (TPR) repeat protein